MKDSESGKTLVGYLFVSLWYEFSSFLSPVTCHTSYFSLEKEAKTIEAERILSI